MTTKVRPAGFDEMKKFKHKTAYRLFTDGGIAHKNPSQIGGTWAYVLQNATEEIVHCDSGAIVRKEWPELPYVSNNFTEVMAILRGLQGTAIVSHTINHVIVYSDSLIAIYCFEGKKKPKYVPDSVWYSITRIRGEFDRIDYHLLGGHPTKEELAKGYNREGYAVHALNVECDNLCREAKEKHFPELYT